LTPKKDPNISVRRKLLKIYFPKLPKPTSYTPESGNPKFLPKKINPHIVKFKDDSNLKSSLD